MIGFRGIMQLTFLGTSCMTPTKERNHSSALLRFKSEGILFDCGEGTQRQIKFANHKLTEITKILISHWHGDHVLGLPGVLQSLGMSEYNKTLEIYGPKGSKKKINDMVKVFEFENKPNFVVYDIEKEGKIFENKNFKIEAFKLEHGMPTLGFVFTEKDRRRINLNFIKKKGIPDGPLLGKLQDGKSITYKGKKIDVEEATYIVRGKKLGFISDTVLCKGCYTIAEGCDVLVCESAYTSALEEKALEYKHMTAKQAGQIASQANVKTLILNHFSPRYKNINDIEEDVKTVFADAICAYDLMKIKI